MTTLIIILLLVLFIAAIVTGVEVLADGTTRWPHPLRGRFQPRRRGQHRTDRWA